jgi:hypothetical protein
MMEDILATEEEYSDDLQRLLARRARMETSFAREIFPDVPWSERGAPGVAKRLHASRRHEPTVGRPIGKIFFTLDH